MTTDSSCNASGLNPEETKGRLPERRMHEHEAPIIVALQEMYTCKLKDTTFDIYQENAVFQDPIGIAHGVDSIRAQFTALSKLFPRADITKFRILENPVNVPTNEILIDQDVAYYRDPDASAPTKTINSLLTLTFNDHNKITSHVEEWDHKKSINGEDGFIGMINEARKKFTGKVIDTVVGKENKTEEKQQT
ncbi:hypothetical protein CPB84DRAFT_1764706 [Gymnopilus junonius]|uniref:Uncharacterized protein n=1 Tax=Gymnopilus junonius TaxID=109634 RepID=A0A9P5NZI9_GYMJU|nr:hypothetical protein CPB84DRAFT_1764706 [Gymnopilus junonius]